jgi:transketolase
MALASESLRPPVIGIGVPELGGKTSIAGSRELLLKTAGLSTESIIDRVERALAKTSA